MSGSSGQRKRVETGPIDVAFLDEIAGRLLELKEMMLEERPEGITEPIEPIEITHLGILIEAPVKPWFTVTIINDGPAEVGARVNPTQSTASYHTIIVHESYKFEFSRAVIQNVRIQCAYGQTASVRLIGVR